MMINIAFSALRWLRQEPMSLIFFKYKTKFNSQLNSLKKS